MLIASLLAAKFRLCNNIGLAAVAKNQYHTAFSYYRRYGNRADLWFALSNCIVLAIFFHRIKLSPGLAAFVANPISLILFDLAGPYTDGRPINHQIDQIHSAQRSEPIQTPIRRPPSQKK